MDNDTLLPVVAKVVERVILSKMIIEVDLEDTQCNRFLCGSGLAKGYRY